MEKYARVLVIIFFLCLFNLGLNIYLLSKIDKPITNQPITVSSPKPTSSTKPISPKVDEVGIQSDLTQIKAEIRSLRDSLESTGLILQTPEP